MASPGSAGCVSFRSAFLYPDDVALLARRAWLNDSVLGLWCEAVEAGAATDPALAREIEALRRAVRLGTAAPPADLEARALGEVRRAVRLRSGWLAGAIFFTVFPLTFMYSGGKMSFLMFRDAPATAILSLVAAGAMWVLFARTARAVR